jgi:hypothetical protein
MESEFLSLLHNQFEMDSVQKESRFLLAIQAIKKDPKFSIRRAAQIYNVLNIILQARFQGR